MIPADFQIPFVIGVLLLMIATLIADRFKTSLVFLVSVAVLLAGGSIALDDFLLGLSNPSIITIFALILITASFNDYFNLAGFFEKLFGKASGQRGFIWRMGLSVSAVSSVMNNTPVVAMMMPYVYNWGKSRNINPSRLLMPLSFAAILGGVITLIGTSTNLVLNGLLADSGQELLGFSDFFVPGVLITLACLFFMFLFGPYLLSDKEEVLKSLEQAAREYLVETRIMAGSPLIGKTVEEAGMRNLQSVFLTEIIRGDLRITPVRPVHRLKMDDVLLFAGESSSVFELIAKTPGLELSKHKKFALAGDGEVLEAIVTQNSQLDRRTVKEVGFREKYDAAIIGVHRHGEKLVGKLGALTLHTGDLLLITTGQEFKERIARNSDLLVINTITKKESLGRSKLLTFLITAAIAVLLSAFGVLSLLPALMIILLMQILLGMMTVEKAKQNISFDLMLVLVSSLAIGKALIDSGAAAWLTDLLFSGAGDWSPLVVLAGIFAATFVLTSLVTNVAAITIIFPIALSLASVGAIGAKPLFLTAAYGASCCFATPIAYQTNLMIMEAGNYRFRDFVRLGLPLSLVYAAVFLLYAAYNFDLI